MTGEHRGVFGSNVGVMAAFHFCDAGRIIVEVPFILRRCQRPKSMLPRDLRDEIDLQNHILEQVGGRHLGVLWEGLGALLDPQEAPRGPQEARGPPGDSQESLRESQGSSGSPR